MSEIYADQNNHFGFIIADTDTGQILNIESIIARRNARPFTDLSDLEIAIPGLDRALLRSEKGMIHVQSIFLALTK